MQDQFPYSATDLRQANTITPQTRLSEDLGIDSLKFIELEGIEQELNIAISDDAVASVRDLGGLLEALALA